MLGDSYTILAIETSCDETGIAVLRRQGDSLTLLSHAVASQIAIHEKTGGVVPNVAAREHAKVITPLIEHVVAESKCSLKDMDAIAVTVGPGLIPALLVGVQAARTLAFSLNKPIIPIHHLEGHIYSALLGEAAENKWQIPTADDVFPALVLIVSGGHTMLVHVDGYMQYRLLGQTRDDAAGEAFDKVARLLDLPYPGGPEVSKLAEQGNPAAFAFPRPMEHSPDFDFSFSGLKTAVLYTLRDTPDANKADVAASFQAAVVDSLVVKTRKVLKEVPYKSLLVTGGVAANTSLRQAMQGVSDRYGVPLHVAPLWLCGDNAVMIAQAAAIIDTKKRTSTWQEVDGRARIALEEFSD